MNPKLLARVIMCTLLSGLTTGCAVWWDVTYSVRLRRARAYVYRPCSEKGHADTVCVAPDGTYRFRTPDGPR